MGVATAVIAGLSLASAIGNFNQSKSEARQTAKQGAIAAQNRADEIKRLAAKQRVSYLQAGLELEGTPQAVINDTYNTGLADINEIKSAYNQRSKNIMTQARANLLGSIAKIGDKAFAGGDETPLVDVTGTAQTGENVSFTNASYIPVQPRKPLFTGGV